MLGATHTLLVLTGHRLARIDFAGRGRRLRVQQVTCCPAPPTSSLATCIAQAWHMHPSPQSGSQANRRRSTPVWLATSDCFQEIIRLPLDTTLLLEPAEIQQALTIEAESLSGMSAFSARQQSVKLVDISSNAIQESQWWVTQLADSDLETMRAVVAHLGGDFQGACHPAMLQSLATGNSISPLEVERALIDWQSTTASDEADLVFQSTAQRLGEAFIHANRLDTLSACTLRLESVRGVTGNISWWQACAASAAILVCGAHYWQGTQALSALQQQVQVNASSLNQGKAAKHELQLAETRIKTCRQQIAEQSARRQQIEKSRLVTTANVTPGCQPWCELLECLSVQSSDDWWLERWDSDEKCVTLHGWAADTAAAINLANQLTQALAAYDCEVQLPTFADQSGIVRFELRIHGALRRSLSFDVPPNSAAARSTADSLNAGAISYHGVLRRSLSFDIPPNSAAARSTADSLNAGAISYEGVFRA